MGTGKLRNNRPSAGKGRSWRWLGLWLALLGSSGAAGAAADRADGALGPYGFLSSAVLGPQPDTEARARVRIMARDYGIREFLFYDWFASYSTPVRGTEWPEPFAGRGKISRRSVEVSVDEIHRHGGRAGAYVQAVAAEERGVGEPLVDGGGRWYWHPPDAATPWFPTYMPNARRHGLFYIAVGDGARRMHNEYWPHTVPLTPAEAAGLRVSP